MFQTKITVHNKMTNKDTTRLLYPIFVWMIIAFVSLGLLGVHNQKVQVISVLVFMVNFVCIIPVSVFMFKKAKKLRNRTHPTRDVMISVYENELYIGDMKITAYYDKYFKTVDLEEATVPSGKGFCASIDSKEVSKFIKFCDESNVMYEVSEFSE